MIRETSPTATVAFNSPLIVPVRLSEDASQALTLVNAILSLNDAAELEPGALQGMSRVLAHARDTWQELRGEG